MNQPSPFAPARLQADATEATGGLTDFGDASYVPALQVLARSLAAEAQLSETGTQILRQKLVGQLANRLWVEEYFARHPEIAGETVADPVVIVGLPRTGTTKLHRMLSRDPRFYWMAFWESQFPVPLPGESLEQPGVRTAQAKEMVRMMTEAMPALAAIHPMDALAADEEVMLMEHSMRSAFSAYAHVPGYDAWMAGENATPAYTYLRRMLQFLQWQKRQRGVTGERWVLKAPQHLLDMDVLLKIFPNARIIQTHRDPLQSIPSLASFIHTLWNIYSDAADAETVGRVWNERMRKALLHTMAVRASAPPQQFLDVDFADTVKQPLAVARRVYEFIGWPLDGAVEQRLGEWLARDAETHQGGHQYSAEQFGLSEAQLREDFADYRARHLQD